MIKILFQGGPINGLQLETTAPPVVYKGAITDWQNLPETDKYPGRHWNAYLDPEHEQFAYELRYYVMDAGAVQKALIYQWVETKKERET